MKKLISTNLQIYDIKLTLSSIKGTDISSTETTALSSTDEFLTSSYNFTRRSSNLNRLNKQ